MSIEVSKLEKKIGMEKKTKSMMRSLVEAKNKGEDNQRLIDFG